MSAPCQHSPASCSHPPAIDSSDPHRLCAVSMSSAGDIESGPACDCGRGLPEARRRRLARDLFLQGLKQALIADSLSTPLAGALPLPSLLGRHLAAIPHAGLKEPADAIPHGS